LEDTILNNQILESDTEKSAFNLMLGTLDYITPIFEDRKIFNERKWSFLEKKWTNQFWDIYELHLPEDLNNEDIFFIVFLLNEKFNLGLDIQKYIWYIRLATKSFTSEEGQELKEKTQLKISEIIESNVLKEDSYLEYKKAINATNFSLRKSIKSIKSIKEYREGKNGTEKTIKMDKWELEELSETLYGQEFDLTFFRKWMNTLRYWLMTLTKTNLEEIKEKQSRQTDKEDIDTSLVIEAHLDEEERKLRNKIWIEDIKIELDNARNEPNPDYELISRLEIEATNKIIETLHTEYPYQMTLNNYWYQPSKISEFKEIHCVWFSLVWHSFLKELWIKHNWLQLIRHSALEIEIWWSFYYFDATVWSKINEIDKEKWEIHWVYKEIILKGASFENPEMAYSWNTEKILLSNILVNKWNSLYHLGQYKEAIEMYDKAIELIPIESNAYHSKSVCLKKLEQFKISNLYFFVYYFLEKEEIIYDNYIREKIKIREFYKNWDFNWIRLYLLELEKEEN
jgi:tetratricopeptide (TPR) repeat protein